MKPHAQKKRGNKYYSILVIGSVGGYHVLGTILLGHIGPNKLISRIIIVTLQPVH